LLERAVGFFYAPNITRQPGLFFLSCEKRILRKRQTFFLDLKDSQLRQRAADSHPYTKKTTLVRRFLELTKLSI